MVASTDRTNNFWSNPFDNAGRYAQQQVSNISNGVSNMTSGFASANPFSQSNPQSLSQQDVFQQERPERTSTFNNFMQGPQLPDYLPNNALEIIDIMLNHPKGFARLIEIAELQLAKVGDRDVYQGGQDTGLDSIDTTYFGELVDAKAGASEQANNIAQKLQQYLALSLTILQGQGEAIVQQELIATGMSEEAAKQEAGRLINDVRNLPGNKQAISAIEQLNQQVLNLAPQYAFQKQNADQTRQRLGQLASTQGAGNRNT